MSSLIFAHLVDYCMLNKQTNKKHKRWYLEGQLKYSEVSEVRVEKKNVDNIFITEPTHPYSLMSDSLIYLFNYCMTFISL